MTPLYFRVTGGTPLTGTLPVGGSKNATFPLLAATLLASFPVVIENIPDIEDIHCFLAILADLGCRIDMCGDRTVSVDPRPVTKSTISSELGQKIRGSYYLLGSLLARFGKGAIPFPGGCDVGNRPMDLHITALRQLGFTLTETAEGVQGERDTHIEDKHTIVFPFPSRGATINVLLASSLLPEHTTVICNANTSPETLTLCAMLQCMSVPIEGIGTGRLVIHGTHALEPPYQPIRVIPDKIEAATLLCAGLITGGTIKVQPVFQPHLDPFIEILRKMGADIQIEHNSIRVKRTRALRSIDVLAGLEPGSLDADWEPPLAALLCTLSGTSTIRDSINPDRHARFLPGLVQMGASVETIDNATARIYGGVVFHSANVMAHDIRGGVALTLAALAAKGTSLIQNVYQIDRGYEHLEKKLQLVGAHIDRVQEDLTIISTVEMNPIITKGETFT